MVDFHMHILPRVDDGSRSMEETLRMLSMAYGQGFRTLIATPHYRADRPHPGRRELEAVFESVREKADKHFHGLTLELGQEIWYFEGLIEALERREAMTIAGSRCVLVEFSCHVSWTVLYRAVRQLIAAGYCPVIAHVERYQELRHEDRLDELAGAGGILQMNYASLTGNLLDVGVRWCRRQVLQGRIHILSTDCHNMTSRKPDIREAMTWLQRRCPQDRIRALTGGNARTLLKQKR